MERIGLTRTRRQIADVMKRVTRKKNPVPFREAWVDHFVREKFGAATTHWSKLQDRVQRGVGNPRSKLAACAVPWHDEAEIGAVRLRPWLLVDSHVLPQRGSAKPVWLSGHTHVSYWS